LQDHIVRLVNAAGRNNSNLTPLAASVAKRARLWRTKESPAQLKIIPGDWGKIGAGWLTRSFGSARCKPWMEKAEFTSSSGDGRASSAREKGAVRQGAMRNRSESAQVAQAGFGLGRIAVAQRAKGCYCAPARLNDSGGVFEREPAQRKTSKDGTTGAFKPGKEAGSGRACDPFQNVGDVTNSTADL
jgi:hypothetical protein